MGCAGKPNIYGYTLAIAHGVGWPATTASHEVTGAVISGAASVTEYLTAMILGIAPVLTAHGIAIEQEIDADAFVERLSADLGPDPLVIQGPDIAAWARKP